MFDRLIEFLAGREVPEPEESADELQLSVAALLIEAAQMDRSFDKTERATIERLLAKRFDLDYAAVESLIAQAHKRIEDSTQYFPFTHLITKRMSAEQRTEIIEMLWKVAYSDGVLDPYEDALVRQIAGLIHVPDRERGLARTRALEKLKAAGAISGEAK